MENKGTQKNKKMGANFGEVSVGWDGIWGQQYKLDGAMLFD